MARRTPATRVRWLEIFPRAGLWSVRTRILACCLPSSAASVMAESIVRSSGDRHFHWASNSSSTSCQLFAVQPSECAFRPARIKRVDGGGWRPEKFFQKNSARGFARKTRHSSARMEKESSRTTISGWADCGNFHCGPVAATIASEHEQFEKKQQRQLEAMDFRPAGLGLDVEAPQHETGNLAAAKTVSVECKSPPAPGTVDNAISASG